MYCRICDGLLPEHRPYVVWHTGWDGCVECDRDYDEGVVVCADCVEALRYAGIGLDRDVYVSDLQCMVDMWAQNTLWHAFWTPERVTVCEADCARRYLDRSGNKDVDPAWDWLPIGIWSDVDEFKADLGSALCRRFLTDDMDGLAAAYLKQGDGWVGTRTRNARKLAERLDANTAPSQTKAHSTERDRQEGIPVENSELKNRKTEAVDAIIAWLDERIDKEGKDMSAGEDDSSWLADREYLRAYRNARSHMTILRDTGECTVQHLAEWCEDRKKEAEKSLQRLLESNTPYGDNAITCADSRRFAYQVIIDRCEEFVKTDLRKVA